MQFSRRGLVGAGLAVAGAGLVSGCGGSTATGAGTQTIGPGGKLPPLAGDFSLGNADAKVQMVEFASPTCPACAAFHGQVLPALKTKYVDTGLVHYILREFAIHGAQDVALMQFARCGNAPAEVYFQRFDVLYRTLPQFAEAAQAGRGAEHMRQMASVAGIPQGDLEACFQDPAGPARAQAVNAEASRLGVNSTPTLFFNGIQVDPRTGPGYTVEALSARIDQILAG
jgi:protein-disulfide isomerase